MAESEFADHQTSRTAAGTSSAEWTLSTVRCCPAKLAAAPSSSTADDRTAKGAVKEVIAFVTFSIALSSPEATASTKSPDSATPGGTGRRWRAASPSPTAFDPKSDVSRALLRVAIFFTRAPKPHRHHHQREHGCRWLFARLLRGCQPHLGCLLRVPRPQHVNPACGGR